MYTIFIPQGKLAMDDAALKAKREALKQSLLQGRKVTIKPDGNVTGSNDGAGISIPSGKLATDDASLQARREALKRNLLAGKKVTIKPETGQVTGENDGTGMSIPPGKLAAQWYESNPSLLEAEKMAMHKFFPNFTLDKLEDGRLYWIGELTPVSVNHTPLWPYIITIIQNKSWVLPSGYIPFYQTWMTSFMNVVSALTIFSLILMVICIYVRTRQTMSKQGKPQRLRHRFSHGL